MPRFNLRPRPGSAGLGNSLRPCTYLTLGLLVATGFILAWEARSGRSVASLIDDTASEKLQASVSNILHSNVSAPVDDDPASFTVLKEDAGTQQDMPQEPDPAASVQNADELKLWKLTHSMMYWAHSNPVPK
jgi:hypothetical protein